MYVQLYEMNHLESQCNSSSNSNNCLLSNGFIINRQLFILHLMELPVRFELFDFFVYNIFIFADHGWCKHAWTCKVCFGSVALKISQRFAHTHTWTKHLMAKTKQREQWNSNRSKQCGLNSIEIEIEIQTISRFFCDFYALHCECTALFKSLRFIFCIRWAAAAVKQ